MVEAKSKDKPVEESPYADSWWLGLLRREGILAVLVLIYIFKIAIPESEARRTALEAMEQTAAAIVKCEGEQSKQLDALIKLEGDVISNQGKILESQGKILKCLADEHERRRKLGGGG